MKKILKITSLCCVGALSQTAQADVLETYQFPVTSPFSNSGQNPFIGGRLSGTFTLDTTTQTFASWNLTYASPVNIPVSFSNVPVGGETLTLSGNDLSTGLTQTGTLLALGASFTLNLTPPSAASSGAVFNDAASVTVLGAVSSYHFNSTLVPVSNVPEPLPAELFSLGLISLFVIRRRRGED